RALMQQRLKAMSDFVFDTTRCRETRILEYFGQHHSHDCGRCDVCRSRRKNTANVADNDQLADRAIIYRLSKATAPQTIADLSDQTALSPETVARRARLLADLGKVAILPGNMLALKN
ncbi:MAG: RecQ family zinc-binding domain-containing protein, partial [Muribaculaceae bacterium]|nr:RecQ family zinc-binding domain-containing protein [Muribaculaceae bacterium]